MFFPFDRLEKSEMPLRMRIGRQSVVIHYEKEAFTAWAEAENGNLLPGVLAYERGWADFNPSTKVFELPALGK